ncbi:MAG: hypothetical protein M5U27_16900 [Gaiella sp.]|nr:hypothetical protein [Gaiella sp.]
MLGVRGKLGAPAIGELLQQRSLGLLPAVSVGREERSLDLDAPAAGASGSTEKGTIGVPQSRASVAAPAGRSAIVPRKRTGYVRIASFA